MPTFNRSLGYVSKGSFYSFHSLEDLIVLSCTLTYYVQWLSWCHGGSRLMGIHHFHYFIPFRCWHFESWLGVELGEMLTDFCFHNENSPQSFLFSWYYGIKYKRSLRTVVPPQQLCVFLAIQQLLCVCSTTWWMSRLCWSACIYRYRKIRSIYPSPPPPPCTMFVLNGRGGGGVLRIHAKKRRSICPCTVNRLMFVMY